MPPASQDEERDPAGYEAAEHAQARGEEHPPVAVGARDPPRVVAQRGRVGQRAGGGDAYLLKSILHDWEDEPAIEILRTCRRAARAGTALLVIERQFALPDTKLSDLNMLVGPGGRERTIEEWGALLASADFRLEEATPTASAHFVIEASPA